MSLLTSGEFSGVVALLAEEVESLARVEHVFDAADALEQQHGVAERRDAPRAQRVHRVHQNLRSRGSIINKEETV